MVSSLVLRITASAVSVGLVAIGVLYYLDARSTALKYRYFRPLETQLAEMQSDAPGANYAAYAAVERSVYKFSSCLVEKLFELDDPVTDYYLSEYITGGSADNIGFRTLGISREEIRTWIATVDPLAAKCEEIALVEFSATL